jgi:pimeloyl-ACP methyl ester carboxylesterase
MSPRRTTDERHAHLGSLDLSSGRSIHAGARLLAIMLISWLAGVQAQAQDAFYAAMPAEMLGKAGTLVRSEAIKPPPGASAAYRILYRSPGLRNEPIVISGVVIVPDGPAPASGRPIVAWGHGTTGVARHCAPSLDPNQFDKISGLGDFLKHGFVVVATDYPGLGTSGMHPYLIGFSQGRAIIDAVRAARTMPNAQAGKRVVIWGYSQGAHAALFTGQIAKTYAPELTLVGIAAAAPPTELGSLIRADVGGLVGRVLSTFALWSWSHLYDIPIESAVDKRVIKTLPRIADSCTETSQDKLNLVMADQAFEQNGFLSHDVTVTEPWRSLIENNTPGITPPGVPIFLAQGSADTIVVPLITELYSDELCSHHRPVRFVLISGADHQAMANAATKLAMAWIVDRFDGLPPPNDCGAASAH